MSFNQRLVFAGGVTGATSAFTTPLTAYKGVVVALTGLTQNSVVSATGLVFPLASQDPEWDSFCALVETDITTSSLQIGTKWQGSGDGTNWNDFVTYVGGASVQVPGVSIAKVGTGSLVTTQYYQLLPGVNPPVRYLRLAFVNQTGTAVTGAAGDNGTVAYCYRRRLNTAA